MGATNPIDALVDRVIVKRLADGRKAKEASGGKVVGAYPYGFRGAGGNGERDAVPDDAEQTVVARIVQMRQSGATYQTIAQTLDAEGLKPRRAARWSTMSVRAVVQRMGGLGCGEDVAR